MLKPITLILSCQLAGEALARASGWPVPGPVIGFIGLFALLALGSFKNDRPSLGRERALDFSPDRGLGSRALDGAGCRCVLGEIASGGRWDRLKLQKMMTSFASDAVVVRMLDRLSCSLKDILHIMERIQIAGAGFRSLTGAIDITTAASRMMMQLVCSFAEF